MRAIAVNGSPRKSANTATLLRHALQGAAEQGAETELVHLYDLAYQGCVSCFACKEIAGKSYGWCAIQDDLAPLLKQIAEADVLLLGTPVYFGSETGAMRSFLERLLFPFLTYTPGYAAIFPGKLRLGLAYTMNVAEKDLVARNYDKTFAATQGYLARIFGHCDLLLATDTCQFRDYSNYVSTCWDADAKKKRHEEVFPLDCQRAFDLGKKLATAAKAS